MFDTARLRLTFWYLAIIAALIGVLSYILYDAFVHLQQAELHAVPRLARFLARDEQTLALEILAIDLGMLVLVALGAYVLAGRTLCPIREVMERQQHFAFAASHELRTPLTVLQGSMEVALLNRRTPEEYEEILQQASGEVQRMGVLTSDLLTLARAESDANTLAGEPLDLAAVARDAAEGVRPLAERKSQTLAMELDVSLPIYGDRLKLRQAVANLLDNAVTYTPESGTIRVSGRCERHQAVLEVRDTGPGIAAEHLPHLFEPFYRVDRARAGGSGHAGMGLALAAWIVRAHGGHIAVESHVGVGSIFTLSLPLVARHGDTPLGTSGGITTTRATRAPSSASTRNRRPLGRLSSSPTRGSRPSRPNT
jgi:two-component system, OmpR family, sensor histidine kinase CiaH